MEKQSYFEKLNKENELSFKNDALNRDVPIIKDDFGIRKLTPRECFNFQGYPKNFRLPNLPNSKLYIQAGNSITYPLVKRIAKEILKVL